MSIFSEIVKEILNEDVDIKSINDAIENTYEVIINYHGEDGEHTGAREIQPVAYGTTKAGFPVIRAFQPNGDTSSRVPSWKFFRVDRIEGWKAMPDKVFGEPPGFDQAAGKFNPNGDDSMSQVFKVASFRGGNPVGGEPKDVQGPVTKADVQTGDQTASPNTVPNNTPGERPVQKQYTQGPITKQDVQAVNQTQEKPEIERLKNKLADQDYVSQAIKDAEYGDEENKEEDLEDNG
jgi:hypothetical protein